MYTYITYKFNILYLISKIIGVTKRGSLFICFDLLSVYVQDSANKFVERVFFSSVTMVLINVATYSSGYRIATFIVISLFEVWREQKERAYLGNLL